MAAVFTSYCSKISLTIYLNTLAQSTSVTDGQMNRQTNGTAPKILPHLHVIHLLHYTEISRFAPGVKLCDGKFLSASNCNTVRPYKPTRRLAITSLSRQTPRRSSSLAGIFSWRILHKIYTILHRSSTILYFFKINWTRRSSAFTEKNYTI